jgi:hypothetical protein
MDIQASVAKRARRWPERGRAGGGRQLYPRVVKRRCRRVAGPVSGSRITQPRWRCRESRSRLAHGCAVNQAGGESPGTLLVLRVAAGQIAIYQRILPGGSGQDRIT